MRCGEEGYPRRTAQPSSAAAEPDEQAQQGTSACACSLEGKSISQVHQLFADLICAEKERARDAAEKVKQQGQDDSILSEATNSHLNLSIQHFIHEIQLQTAASSASVRKSRTLVLARIDKRRYY